jgi:hypothetical protein
MSCPVRLGTQRCSTGKKDAQHYYDTNQRQVRHARGTFSSSSFYLPFPISFFVLVFLISLFFILVYICSLSISFSYFSLCYVSFHNNFLFHYISIFLMFYFLFLDFRNFCSRIFVIFFFFCNFCS